MSALPNYDDNPQDWERQAREQELMQSLRALVPAMPRPIRELAAQDNFKEYIRLVQDLLKSNDHAEIPNLNEKMHHYAMTAINFEPLWETQKLPLNDDQRRDLASTLWSAYLKFTDADWPMSRYPGRQYVTLEFGKSQAEMIAAAVQFMDQAAWPVIEQWWQQAEIGVWPDADLELTDLLWVGIGRDVDSKNGDHQPCDIHFFRGVNDTVVVAENAPGSLEVVYGSVVTKDPKLREHANASAAEGRKVLPIVYQPPVDVKPDFIARVPAKGVELPSRIVYANEIEEWSKIPVVRHEPTKLDDDTLKFLARTMAAETYLPYEQLVKSIQTQALEGDLGKDLISVELTGEEGKVKVIKTGLDLLSIEVESVQMSGLDLSGMSKIALAIDRLQQNSNFDAYDYHAVKDGWEEFRFLWLQQLSKTLRLSGFVSDEYGGDGVKGLFLGEEGGRAPWETVFLAMELNSQWDHLLGKAMNEEDPESNIGQFVYFLNDAIRFGEIGHIAIKTAMAETKAFFDIHASGMVELRTEQDLDELMDVAKQYIRQTKEADQDMPVFTVIPFNILEKLGTVSFDDGAEGRSGYLLDGLWKFEEFQFDNRPFYIVSETQSGKRARQSFAEDIGGD
jgi:hypothetical protein